MGKIKFMLFVFYSLFIAGAAFSLANYLIVDPHGPVVTDKTPIESNVVQKNPYTMPMEYVQNDLQCFYTGFPALDIQSVGKDDYMLSASLCERRWQKVVNIKARDSPRNMVIGGVSIDTGLRTGAWAQY
jgi:hypothetical protein